MVTVKSFRLTWQNSFTASKNRSSTLFKSTKPVNFEALNLWRVRSGNRIQLDVVEKFKMWKKCIFFFSRFHYKCIHSYPADSFATLKHQTPRFGNSEMHNFRRSADSRAAKSWKDRSDGCCELLRSELTPKPRSVRVCVQNKTLKLSQKSRLHKLHHLKNVPLV